MADGVIRGFPSYGWRVLITVGAALAAIAAVVTMIAAFIAFTVLTVVSVIVFAAATALTLVSLGLGARRERAERTAGYSTAFDVPGLALRHPHSGVIVRAANEPTGALGISRARWRQPR